MSTVFSDLQGLFAERLPDDVRELCEITNAYFHPLRFQLVD